MRLITASLALLFCCRIFIHGVTAVEVRVDSSRWEREIAAFESVDRLTPPPENAVLFVGSSSIRLWTTLAADFSPEHVINRGFGGSHVSDCTNFVERIVIPYKPRLIIFYAGGNDINAGKSPVEVAEAFRRFAVKVRTTLPQTEIAYISIAPNPARSAQIGRVKETNTLIESFCRERPYLKFIDVFEEMLGSDGRPRPEIFSSDRLHMNAEGYRLWTRLIRPYLKVSVDKETIGTQRKR